MEQIGASRATGIWPKTSDRPLTKYVIGANGGQVGSKSRHWNLAENIRPLLNKIRHGGKWGASRATEIWPKISDRPLARSWEPLKAEAVWGIISKLSIISISTSIIISIVSILISILNNTNTWFSTLKKARNPGHANNVLKTHCTNNSNTT